MVYKGFFEILMITLISSKKLGVCNNMRYTVHCQNHRKSQEKKTTSIEKSLDAGGFMPTSNKKLLTFEFLFSWHNRTFLLNENQRTLLRSQCRLLQRFPTFFSAALKLLLGFSQQLQNRAKIHMFSTLCRSLTSLRLSFSKILTTLQ